jgi:hypothetical protein
MIADLELTLTETGPCASCGRRHRHRVVLTGPRDSTVEALLGFFGPCPDTGRRVWHVAPLPRAREAGGRVLRIGPADDEEWAPAAGELPFDHDRRPAAGDGFPPRGRQCGGFRDRHHRPDLLRRVLGCPIW